MRVYTHHYTPLHDLRKELVPKATEALWSAFNYGDYTQFTDVLVQAAQLSAGTLINKAAADPLQAAINDEAYDWALNHAGDLVDEIDAKTNAAIARITAQAFKQGWTDSQITAALAKLPGLDEAYVDSVDNFRDTMIKQGRSAAAAETAASNFAEQLRYNRAQTIAATEVSAALNEGQRIVWRDADANGQLPPMVRRQWMLDPTELTCNRCTKLDGTVTTLDSDFGPDADWSPPLHPNCNCTEQLLDLENNVLDSPDDFSKGDTPGHEFHGNQYYHLSGSENRESIRSTGLRAGKPLHPLQGQKINQKRVYLTAGAPPKNAGDDIDVWVVDTAGMSLLTDPDNPKEDYYVTRNIPSSRVKLAISKGDTPGHEFHGNQWTGGTGTTVSDQVKLRGVPSDLNEVRELTSEVVGDWKTNPDALQDRTAKVLSGDPSVRDDYAAAALLTSVANAPVINQPLYRGIKITTSPDEVMQEFPVGKEFNLGVQGFSTQEFVAQQFAGTDWGGKEKGTPVQYELASGAKALPIEYFTNPAFANSSEHQNMGEAEHLTAGSFKVTSIRTGDNPAGGSKVYIGLQQVQHLQIPTGGF